MPYSGHFAPHLCVISHYQTLEVVIMQDDFMSQMRDFSRRHMRLVWEMSGVDESALNDDDRVLVEVMRMHPEYYDLWGQLDELSQEEIERDGTNPILHVTIHQIVENQIANGEPAEAAKTLQRLMKQGKTRHQALHEVGKVLTEEMFEVLKANRPYNERRYVARLRRLGTGPKKRKRHRR